MANQCHAYRNATYLGPREVEQGLVRVKRMADGDQEDVAIPELPQFFLEKLAAAPSV